MEEETEEILNSENERLVEIIARTGRELGFPKEFIGPFTDDVVCHVQEMQENNRVFDDIAVFDAINAYEHVMLNLEGIKYSPMDIYAYAATTAEYYLAMEAILKNKELTCSSVPSKVLDYYTSGKLKNKELTASFVPPKKDRDMNAGKGFFEELIKSAAYDMKIPESRKNEFYTILRNFRGARFSAADPKKVSPYLISATREYSLPDTMMEYSEEAMHNVPPKDILSFLVCTHFADHFCIAMELVAQNPELREKLGWYRQNEWH